MSGEQPKPTAGHTASPASGGAGFVARELKEGRDAAARNHASGANPLAGAGSAVSGAADKTGDWFGKTWDSIKNAFGDMSKEGGVGSILGAIIGLGGAWFAGNFMGGGVMGTILTIALAVPLSIIGSDKIGGMINGWMGVAPKPVQATPARETPAAARTASPARDTAPIQPMTRTEAPPAPARDASFKTATSSENLTLTAEELAALVQSPGSDATKVKFEADAKGFATLRAVPMGTPNGPGIYPTAKLAEIQLQCSTPSEVAGIAFQRLPDGGFSTQCVPARGARPTR